MSARARTRWKQDGLAAVLLFALAVSAIVKVNAAAQVRDEVSRLDALQREHDQLLIDSVQLQLEEGARTSHGLVESSARRELGMFLPGAADVRLVQ